MNEHVFSLKMGIDYFKHSQPNSIPFRDAFGTLPHSVMINSLVETNLPKVYVDVVKDIYAGSFIQVICGDQLTEPIELGITSKPGVFGVL